MKQHLGATLLPNPPRTNGSGDLYRMTVEMKIHFGPKAVIGRKCGLVMNSDEAFEHAVDILNHIAISDLTTFIDESPRRLDDLRKLVAILDVARKDGK